MKSELLQFILRIQFRDGTELEQPVDDRIEGKPFMSVVRDRLGEVAWAELVKVDGNQVWDTVQVPEGSELFYERRVYQQFDSEGRQLAMQRRYRFGVKTDNQITMKEF